MKKITAKTQFRIGTALILLLFCVAASVLEYVWLKKTATQSIYKETEIFITTVEATRTYVKDVTRPRMTELLSDNAFVREVMSTSYVGREIMSRVREQFPEFIYKRAATSPINPINQADAFEQERIRWFAENRDKEQWSGVIRKADQSYFARMKAIYAENDCLACHGDPADAPQAMKDIYGSGKGGYWYNVGNIVAADTIYIPVDVAFSRIKEKAFGVFLIGICSLFILFALFYILFNRTVMSQLKGLIYTFRNISESRADTPKDPEVEYADEVEQLKEAFENAAVSLKQAHDELKASESKYRRLFAASQDAIFICDMQCRLQDINDAGIRMFGFSDRQTALAIETFYQLFQKEKDAVRLWNTVQEQGFVKEHEATMVNNAGQRMDILITANLRLDENEQPCGFVGVLRDITEKKRMEATLAQTEKLASIGQLAAGVAHELNNPLGVIRCYAGLIRKNIEPEAQTLEDLQIIEKHTRNCKAVVEALLSFARVSEPMMTRSDIHACIDEVLKVIGRHMQKNEIQIECCYGQDIPEITFDVQKMKQVFMNLLMNAQQAIGDAGRITITTALTGDREWLAIEVTDDGVGITEKDLGRIFEPFFTTKVDGKGTGLGLALTYGIVKQHGGDIVVKSTAGVGSTFTVMLKTTTAKRPEKIVK